MKTKQNDLERINKAELKSPSNQVCETNVKDVVGGQEGH